MSGAGPPGLAEGGIFGPADSHGGESWRAWLNQLAASAGFFRAGVAPARLHGADGTRLKEWLGCGYHGSMGYMAQGPDRRHDAGHILPGARSVIMLAAAYDPPPVFVPPRGGAGGADRAGETCPVPPPPPGHVGIAAYATGEDYHLVLKERLNSVVIPALERQFPGGAFRAVTDSAPLLERAYAVRAGLGFIGKNTLHIVPGSGSFHFLAAVVTTAWLPRTPVQAKRGGAPAMPDCGKCTRCLDACPTDAFVAPFVLDARKCISYQTIEFRGELDQEQQAGLRGLVFGCDICQQVCPYNKAAAPTLMEEFKNGRIVRREEPLSTFEEIGSNRQFERRFARSAVMRAGWKKLRASVMAAVRRRRD